MLLLDTSFLIEYETEIAADEIGPARTVRRANPLESVAVSVISLGEFAEGFSNPAEVDAALSRFTIVQLSRKIAYDAVHFAAALW